MKFTRRTFLKGSAAAGGLAMATQVVPGSPLKLVAGELETPTADSEEIVPTTCWIGKQDCRMLARKINGRDGCHQCLSACLFGALERDAGTIMVSHAECRAPQA